MDDEVESPLDDLESLDEGLDDELGDAMSGSGASIRTRSLPPGSIPTFSGGS